MCYMLSYGPFVFLYNGVSFMVVCGDKDELDVQGRAELKEWFLVELLFSANDLLESITAQLDAIEHVYLILETTFSKQAQLGLL